MYFCFAPGWQHVWFQWGRGRRGRDLFGLIVEEQSLDLSTDPRNPIRPLIPGIPRFFRSGLQVVGKVVFNVALDECYHNCRGVCIWVMMQTHRYFYKYTKIGNDCLCWSTLAFRRHTFCSLICRWPVVTACQSWYCMHANYRYMIQDTVLRTYIHLLYYLEFWFWAYTHCPCEEVKKLG